MQMSINRKYVNIFHDRKDVDMLLELVESGSCVNYKLYDF